MYANFRSNKAFLSSISLVSAIILIVVLHVAHIVALNLWTETFLNSMHVVVFALVGLLIFAGLASCSNMSVRRRIVTTLIASFTLAAISEAAQIAGPRDASYGDLLLDCMGSAGALLLLAGLRTPRSVRRLKQYFLIGSGCTVLFLALLPLAVISTAYLWRNYNTPILISFNSILAQTFVRPQNAELSIAALEHGTEKIGYVTLRRGAWPGLIIHDIWPDWEPYSDFIIDISLPEGDPLDIHVRIHDQAHRAGEQLYTDRFNMSRMLAPGFHSLRIPLDAIQSAPLGRQMDMSMIDGIVIFCTQDQIGRVFAVHEIRLE